MTKKAITLIVGIIFGLFVILLIAIFILGKTSKTYNEMIDKNKYEQLAIMLKVENIKQIIVTRPNDPANYITDYSVFEKINYEKSAWDVKSNKWAYRVGLILKNNPNEIVFSSEGTERFSVAYQNRIFIVNLPELIDSIKEIYK